MKSIVFVLLLVLYTLAGEPFSIGVNSYAQLGDGTKSPSSTLDKVQGALLGKNITEITAKGFLNVALDSEGRLYSWGTNNNYALGSGTGMSSTVSVSVQGISELITSASCGWEHGLALSTNQKVYTWGSYQYGQSINSGGNDKVAHTIDSLAGQNIVAVAAGQYHSLALAR
jgi:alpha-tubulin suppressor-like RCC1 family protein